MGESVQEPLRVEFDARVRLEFVGSQITSDAGLLAHRELDEKLGLTAMASEFLAEQRSGRNVQHHLVPLVRQSVYSRLAGYPDTNDADRLSRDPAMRLVVSKRASDRRAAARNTVGRFETGVLATDDNQDGLVAVPAVRPSTGSRAVRGPLLPLGGLPGASAGAARAAPAPSLDFRHVGIYGVDYGFLDFTNYKFSDPSAGATYARLVHEAKERGQIVTLGLYTWDRVSHKKPLEEVLADTNRILDAVNLQEVDLICLHEEEVDWQGGFEYLNAVYDHVKQKYPGPVYQWYSMPMGPRWDQKADGWILDAYGMDYATFRRHLMRSLRPLPRRSSAHLPAAKAGWRTDSATSSFVSAPTTVGAQPKRPLSRPRRPPQGVARTGLRSWGAYGNRAGGWMVEVLRTVPIPGAGDAERAGVDGTGGMPSRLRHPGPPMEHGRRSSQRHTR